jgi:glycosyltransferase involved in cell wall biosynthesis
VKFDLVFLDTVSPYQYEVGHLETRPLGGTEQTVIRMAEGLAERGLKVAVVLNRPFEIMGKAFYLPLSYLDKIKPDRVVHLRSVGQLHLFPNAKQYVWMHDLAQPYISEWEKPLREANATVISVSNWHKQNIQTMLKYENIISIHPPIDENCYFEHRSPYNPNAIVWMASPHKGLVKGLKTFEKLHKLNPKIELLVLNPGYFSEEIPEQPGVRMIGSVSRTDLRNIVSRVLTLFYPTNFEETFGMIAAESNALGTPVATYKVAALSESVASENPFAVNEDDLCQMILKWQEQRLVVKGQDRFRMKNVIKEWLRILA